MEAFFILIWVTSIIAGTVSAGDRKIGTGVGFLVCFLLGVIGLIIVLSSPKILDASGSPIPVSPAKLQEPVSSPSPNVDDLIKFASLLEKGLITKEEFDREKAKLFN